MKKWLLWGLAAVVLLSLLGADGDVLLGLAAIGAMIALYFLPAIVAFARKKDNAVLLSFVNAVFGWFPLVWIFTLVWAVNGPRGDAPKHVVVRSTEHDHELRV